MSDHDAVMELTEAISSLELLARRALDERRGRRCFVYAAHTARHGLLGVGLLVVVGGDVIGTLSACLPLARRTRKNPADAARLACTALALGVTPACAHLGLGFEAATDLSGLPHELIDLTEGRRRISRRPRRETERNARACHALAEHALTLGPWRGLALRARTANPSAPAGSAERPEGVGLHVYVDGSADDAGNLGWACVWVQDGTITRVEAGGRVGWHRDAGCDGATAAEREAVWLALSRLRDLRQRSGALEAVLHSDRVDLQRMAEGEDGIRMTLTHDRNHVFMRLAHNTSRAARRDATRACTRRAFAEAAD